MIPYYSSQITDMVRAYFECAAWANEDDGRERLDSTSDEVIRENIRDVVNFWHDSHDDLAACRERFNRAAWSIWEQHGHDFYLTRNGHGAGFWDRGYGEIGRRLTESCEPYGVSDDLNVYLMEDDDDVRPED